MKVVVLFLLVAMGYSCSAQNTDWFIPDGRTDSAELHKYVIHQLNLGKERNRQLREVATSGLPKLKQTLGLFFLLSINDKIMGYKADSSAITRAEVDSLAGLLDSSKVVLEEHRVLYLAKGKMIVRILRLVFVDTNGNPLAEFRYPEMRNLFKQSFVRHPIKGDALMPLDEYFENRYFKVE